MAGKVPTHKWIDQKACRDFIVSSQADLRQFFGKDSHRIHKKEFAVYSLGESIVMGLGHGDIFNADISIRYLENFRVEAAMLLAKHLAEYIIAPQRYGHHPRHAIASSINLFASRIGRFRSGHKLSYKSRRMISKHQLGILVARMCEHSYLWELSERYVTFYHSRLRRGYCDTL